MVIQLTDGELAILEQAARGLKSSARGARREDLKLLMDMQLIIEVDHQLEITLIGQHVLKMAQRDVRRKV